METNVSLGEALDWLHDKGHPRPRAPRVGSTADRISMAAVVLLAIMRVVPDEFVMREPVAIEPDTGRVLLCMARESDASVLAERLGLTRRPLVELDAMVLCQRWSGHWHGWPVAILRYVEAT